MYYDLFVAQCYINTVYSARVLINIGYSVYDIISKKIVRKFKLFSVSMKSRYVKRINKSDELISNIMYLKNFNINKYHERNLFLYLINNIFNYDLILEKLFINR